MEATLDMSSIKFPNHKITDQKKKKKDAVTKEFMDEAVSI